MKLVAKRMAAVFFGFLMAAPVHAYVGPGAGLSAIGSALALIGAVLLMIAGFIWYPVKRLLRRRKNPEAAESNGDEAEVSNDPEISDDPTATRPDQG